MSADDPLADRRQRAREAAYDGIELCGQCGKIHGAGDVEEAIEAAIRVKLTPEIVVAFEDQEADRCCDCGANTKAGLAAAFRAAGFEVEE
jgi:hypothetical protein